ncbi:MAG: hypothetical protein ACJAYC_000010 [Halieaceae bacterium]|jgi:hypothetical protein
MKIFALIVLLVILAVVIWIVVTLGAMPGKIAVQKQHPQAAAINVLGWIGIVTLGVGWFVAIVWAYSKPIGGDGRLQQRIDELEQTVAELQRRGTPL